MGNGQSSPLSSCLNDVCNGRLNCVGYPDNPLYQLTWVNRYNLDIDVEPVAVTRPDNADDVAAFIKCATEHDVPVQARSGGHSYAYVIRYSPVARNPCLTDHIIEILVCIADILVEARGLANTKSQVLEARMARSSLT